jgi:hypothetical protein
VSELLFLKKTWPYLWRGPLARYSAERGRKALTLESDRDSEDVVPKSHPGAGRLSYGSGVSSAARVSAGRSGLSSTGACRSDGGDVTVYGGLGACRVARTPQVYARVCTVCTGSPLCHRLPGVRGAPHRAVRDVWRMERTSCGWMLRRCHGTQTTSDAIGLPYSFY